MFLPRLYAVGMGGHEKQGFGAVAATSAGIAYSLGLTDGECMTFDELVSVTEETTRRITVPLSVDFEGDYGETGEEVKENADGCFWQGHLDLIWKKLQADGTLSLVGLQTDKINALIELKKETGIDFVINAHTCACWLDISKEDENAVHK